MKCIETWHKQGFCVLRNAYYKYFSENLSGFYYYDYFCLRPRIASEWPYFTVLVNYISLNILYITVNTTALYTKFSK